MLPARLRKRLSAAAAWDPCSAGRDGAQPGKKVHAVRQYKCRADDEASAFLGPGQRVTLWNGHEIGHGVISRRVFFTTAP